MKQMPTDDDAFGQGTIRADGRKIQDSFLFEVKAPGESHNPWDLMKLQGTLPAAQSIYPPRPGLHHGQPMMDLPISDELAIRNLLSRYVHYVDDGDPEAWALPVHFRMELGPG